MLEKLREWADEIEPLKQAMRYGNKAFRSWFEKVEGESGELLKQVLPQDVHPSIVEVKHYLIHSFGNKVRIDYGTGHETNFVAFLVCVDELGCFKEEEGDYSNVVLRVFNKYLSLVRKVQQRYGLEPAGSHGVWSLDDYQFLPFLWGSAQLKQNKEIKPNSVNQVSLVEQFSSDFLYLSSILYILSVKKGPFGEHSPVLHSLTNLPHWEKINEGMFKMYKAEVVGKFPIIQHFLFASLLPL